MYKCVICDSDIPMTYRKEHNSSFKHKTCVKIAEAVLQRIQGHLLMEDNNDIVTSSSHTYFCAPCTVIVKDTDKIEHEASNDHQKAMLHDRCLNDLLNVYLDKDYLDSADMQYLKPRQSNKDIEDHSLPSCSFDEFNVMNKINVLDVIGANVKNKPACRVIPNYSVNYAKYLSSESSFDSSDNLLTLSVHQMLEERSKIINKQKTVFDKDDGHSFIAQKSVMNVETHTNVDKNDAIKKHSLVEQKSSTDMNLPVSKIGVVDEHNDPINIDNFIEEPNQSVNDDNNKAFDAQHQFIVDQTSSTDALNHSIDEQNNSIDEQHVIIDSERTDEKQRPIDDQNKPITDQNNETTKPKNSVVDYVILVDSKQFYVDVKTDNENSNILNESDLEKYLDMLTKFTNEGRPSHKLSFLNKDYIKIETLDNSIVTVRADNFNGFYLKDGQLQCRVCMVAVDEDPSNHIYNVDHIGNVWLPLEDMHCFRKINDSTVHCVHCNETFCNYDLHKFLESHLSPLKEAMGRSIPAKPIKPNKVSRSYCEPCKMYIDSHKLNSHTNSKRHTKNKSRLFRRQRNITKYLSDTNNDKSYCNKCNSYVVTANFVSHSKKHVEEESPEAYTKNMKINDDSEIHCEPCNLQIRKDKFPSHLYGKTHRETLKLSNECEGHQKIYCGTCNLYTDRSSSHVSGAYHEYYVKRNQKKNHFKTLTPSTSISGANIHHIIFVEMIKSNCKICKIKFTYDAGHTKREAHVSNYNAFLDTNLLKIVNNKFFCGVCEITVVPTKELEHIRTTTHKSALVQFRTAKTFCDKCKTYVLTENRSRHLSGEYHKFHLRITNTPENNDVEVPTPSSLLSDKNTEYQIEITKLTEAICRVCVCSLGKAPNILEDITLHSKGRTHNANFNELLYKNIITKIDDKFFCEVCVISIEPSGELEHFESKTHKYALAQFNADPILSTPYIQEHEKAFFRLAKGLIETSLHNQYVREGKNIDTITCRLCNINVSVEHSKKHLESLAHNSKYRSLLNENKVQKVNNKYFCEICSEDVQDREELKHIRSLTHLFEKQLALSTNSCAVCKVLPSEIVG